MSFLPKPSGPRASWQDFMAFVRQREREHVIGATLAVLVTLIIVIVFLIDPKVNTQPPEQITYVDIYPANRTDADIIRDQKKDAAAREEFKRKKQATFRKLDQDLNQVGL